MKKEQIEWHINKSGIPKICKAKVRDCPLGKHFISEQEAQDYADQINENITTKPNLTSKYLTKEEYNQFIKSINFNKELKTITDYSNKFIKDNFGLDPINIPIRFDGRLRDKMGIFKHTENEALELVFSKNQFINAKILGQEEEVLYGTLGHELTHYALFKLGKDFNDGDEEFENKLAELNLPSSDATPIELRKSKRKNSWTDITNHYITPEGEIIKYGGAYYNKDTVKKTIIIRQDGSMYMGDLKTVGYNIEYSKEE